MNYLIDTNVISETIRKKPTKKVLNWLNDLPSESLYISVLTLGEIRKGLEKIEDKKRQKKLIMWFEKEIPNWFEDRVLSIDQTVADRWGRLLGQVKRPLPVIDSLLAATALHHDLRLVTRNLSDFEYPSLEVVNPWD